MKFTKKDAKELANILGYDGDINEFYMGINVELEHGTVNEDTNITDDDPILTAKIALAHLNEIDDYYSRLSIMEKETPNIVKILKKWLR